MMTMRNTRYSMSQRFIERFDLDIVTLKAKANLPPWYKNHLDMLVRAVFLLSSCTTFPADVYVRFLFCSWNRCFMGFPWGCIGVPLGPGFWFECQRLLSPSLFYEMK